MAPSRHRPLPFRWATPLGRLYRQVVFTLDFEHRTCMPCGQSYKHFTLVNYDSKVALNRKLSILRLRSRNLWSWFLIGLTTGDANYLFCHGERPFVWLIWLLILSVFWICHWNGKLNRKLKINKVWSSCLHTRVWTWDQRDNKKVAKCL